MQGMVFQPMGFDAFGCRGKLHQTVSPEDSTLSNIGTMEKQLRAMGAMFDWITKLKPARPATINGRSGASCSYKRGLAYRRPPPSTGAKAPDGAHANEQVVDGGCERCHTPVKRKHLTQWFFKITDYAERLLQNLDKLDWPEKTKMMQRNWIGKSIGSEITFTLESGDTFTVFTTRADTLFGCTYAVLAPEHPLTLKITTDEQRKAVEEYIEFASRASEIDRLSTTREKTGVFTGAYAINPINGLRIPVFVADYVLATYGTGAVMAVPGHDERDFEFAVKYDLPIIRVIKGQKAKAMNCRSPVTMACWSTAPGSTG